MSDPVFDALEAARRGTVSLVLASSPAAARDAVGRIGAVLDVGFAGWRWDLARARLDVGGATIYVRHGPHGSRGFTVDGFLWVYDADHFLRSEIDAALCATATGARVVGAER